MKYISIFLLMAALAVAGCKSSGESDLERQLDGNPDGPGSNPDGPGGNCKVSGSSAQDEDDIRAFYDADVYPLMQADCMDCHVAGGDASDSGFVLSLDDGADYALIRELTERKLAGYPYLLAKASALAGHTGGVRFGLASPEAAVLTDFADLLAGIDPDPDTGGNPGNCDDDDDGSVPGGDTEFFKGISLLSAEETLNKAAMVMLGRRATGAELEAVADGSAGSLRRMLREMMSGPSFTVFLTTTANDQLLTNKFASGVPLNSDGDLSYYRFDTLDWPGIMDPPHYDIDDFYNEDLAKEPLALIAYIVNNERDYRDVVRGNYTVFNSRTYEFFDQDREGYVLLVDPDTGEAVPPPATPDEWVAGRFAPGVGTGFSTNGGGTSAMLPYPHAGVLTTLPWLARWQNTNTNGQRKRAKMVMKQFLGYDIELTASRPMNADALNDPNNPTFNNPACTACHYQLDAVAGAFQNWGYTGRFRLNDLHFSPTRAYNREDALNDGYKAETQDSCGEPLGQGGYCDGDLWYRDRFPAGFVFQGESTISEMPNDGPGRIGMHDDATLRWLGEQLVQDPRFATGAVKFWYEGVFNEKPLVQPVEGDPNYDAKIHAYIAQQELIQEIADVFVSDNGNGPYNVKDMLVEMFVSTWFRAASVDDSAGRDVELANIGMGTFLTPEQLERKIESTLGIEWKVPDENGLPRPALTYIFNAMYGGIDSDTVNFRTRQVNPLMLAVVKRMVSEAACEVVYRDFILEREEGVPVHNDPMVLRPADQRLLFGGYTGEPPTDEATIKNVLAHIHRQLWNDGATVDSAEVQASYDLFVQFWDYEEDVNGENMRCESNDYMQLVPDDDAYSAESMRVWRDMLIYFMSDAQFLHE